jgi:serine/threonine protein kinase
MDPSSSVFDSTVQRIDEPSRPYHVNHPSLTYTLTSVIKVLAIKRFSPWEMRNTRIVVGQGATSSVFKTSVGYPNLHKLVAVKQKRRKGSSIDPDSSLNSWLRTCYADLRVMGDTDLKSRNLMHVLGYYWETFEIDGVVCLSPCLVMPKADSVLGDLFQSLRELSQVFTLSSKIKLCADITSGIHCLHKYGIVHGDIKFDNVLFFKDSTGFTVKISDFSHSIFLNDEHSTFPSYVGTPPYWPPEVRIRQRIEQSSGTQPQRSSDELLACDVYQVGVLILRVLNDGRNFIDLMKDAYSLTLQDDENLFGLGIYVIFEESVFESTDSLLDNLYSQPFMFLFFCQGLVRHRL